jgi:hypothetical protein
MNANICPICHEAKPALDVDGHCSYTCASGAGNVKKLFSFSTNGVDVTIAEDAKILLHGNTFVHREKIKSLGGTWEPAAKTWTLPPATELGWLSSVRLSSVRVKAPAPAPAPALPPPATLSAGAAYQLYLSHSRKKSHGRCCSLAVSYESRPYGPLCYRCDIHGATINDTAGD